MKHDFVVDPHLRSLIPPLAPEELKQLTENLRAEGCREKLVVGYIEGRPLLLDGHHRYEICTKERIHFEVRVTPQVTTYQEAVLWMITNQLGRRNLTPEQASYLRGKRYNLEKKQGKRTDVTSPQSEGKSHTAARLASDYKVSPSTIERDGQYAGAMDTITEVIDPDARQKILSGERPLTKQDIMALGKLVKTKPEEARKTYTRIIEDDGRPALEPELVEPEPKKRRSLKGRKHAFHTLVTIALGMLQVRSSQSAEQVRQWGKRLLAAIEQAQHGTEA